MSFYKNKSSVKKVSKETKKRSISRANSVDNLHSNFTMWSPIKTQLPNSHKRQISRKRKVGATQANKHRPNVFPVVSFRFDAKKLLELYATNKGFRMTIDSSNYVLADGYLVLNSPKFVYYENGLHIKATNNVRKENFCFHQISICTECELEIPATVDTGDGLQAVVTKKEKVVSTLTVSYRGAKNALSVADITKENASFIFGDNFPPTDDFNTLMACFIEKSKLTHASLSEITGISEKTIGRICSSNYHPSLETVIALCVGLNIDPYNSTHLIRLAGYNLTNSRRDRAYRFIINCAYTATVYDCNRMLERLGFEKTLSRL